MWIGLGSPPAGSCDPPPLPGSKEHRYLLLPEKSFPVVFRHGGHGYECGSVSDHLQGGHVTLPHFQGQKNIENYFCLKNRSQWFSGLGNTDMSVDQSQVTSRGSFDPPPLPKSKEHRILIFHQNVFPEVSRCGVFESKYYSVRGV